MKTLGEFARMRNGGQGRTGQCRQCTSEARSQHFSKPHKCTRCDVIVTTRSHLCHTHQREARERYVSKPHKCTRCDVIVTTRSKLCSEHNTAVKNKWRADLKTRFANSGATP